MSKLTSVEWLLTKMTNMQYFIGNDLLQAFEQAKEMHKQEIIDAAERWKGTDFAERYYKETYQSVDTNEMINVREQDLHELEVLRNKIKREIGEREPQSKFGSGYKQALIDVEGMIMDMLIIPSVPKQNDVREDGVENQVPDVRKMVENVEKLAEKYPYGGREGSKRLAFIDGYWEGYNKAKETLYTEEQVRNIVLKFVEEVTFIRQGIAIIWVKNYFKSLKQHKQ